MSNTFGSALSRSYKYRGMVEGNTGIKKKRKIGNSDLQTGREETDAWSINTAQIGGLQSLNFPFQT